MQHSSTGVLTFVTEPQAGAAPWLNAISDAHSVIDANEYLLTDYQIIAALRAAASRGVQVDVIVDGRPYDDATAPSIAVSGLKGSGVHLKMAPSRFEGQYAFDHAKYLIVDPGRPDQVAIFGSPNATEGAFDGENIEDALETTNAVTIAALTAVFHADWTGTVAGASPRAALVLSPGSGSVIAALLAQTGTVAVMAEELGDAPACYAALIAHGSGARVLIPADPSWEATSYANELVRAGVQVRVLESPYVHAKLIVTPGATFVGSENLSVVSFDDNREVGMITANPTVRVEALAWFDSFWNNAVAWSVSGGATPTPTSPAPTPTTPTPTPAPSGGNVQDSYPYLNYGDTKAEVIQLWGSPTSTTSASYDGYPEVVWIYPVGRVYFEDGAVSYVQRTQ
ncbi:phospholipase D-like domain-containing protein [Ferrimicrobium sp.]|uniref:phospholipase D-like domain-containing protein n=1 Tax=Ferrimicrobium sp. TaxID=2926050 RepID=UPI002607525A|nr:phospholipase D-like domain-containing protein [Ferrimicrobium sp.]